MSAGLRIGHAHYRGNSRPLPGWAMLLLTWLVFVPLLIAFLVAASVSDVVSRMFFRKAARGSR